MIDKDIEELGYKNNEEWLSYSINEYDNFDEFLKYHNFKNMKEFKDEQKKGFIEDLGIINLHDLLNIINEDLNDYICGQVNDALACLDEKPQKTSYFDKLCMWLDLNNPCCVHTSQGDHYYLYKD